ncbi:hypothetical protein BJY24_007183 [Nocardia transvalensis]|uniref:Uncharacterized protein n=1 Tax=Nocardia transvalensis TaxID=37333 RepID=A0A7W9UM49_9NOCA|nr:hypothetical protein [Nocardia transvalensis]MBB5918271.1 hypothetical protein [Nocardia transvalensis]
MYSPLSNSGPAAGSDTEPAADHPSDSLATVTPLRPSDRSRPRRPRSSRPEPVDLPRLRAWAADAVEGRLRDALGPDSDAAERLAAVYVAAVLDAGLGYADDARGAPTTEQVVHRILTRR